MKVFQSVIFTAASLLLLASCKSVPVQKKIPQILDYTDADIVKTEKERITSLMESEPVQALWRAWFLKDTELTEICLSRINLQINKELEAEDYYEVRRLTKSLEAFGYKNEKISFAEADRLFCSNIPGLWEDRNLLPKNIGDCVKATVTVFVDKGIKVQGGVGYADRVLGSGFFIDKRGYIVTNHHVISDMVDPKYEGYSRLYIKFSDDEETKIPAKVIGYDSVMDLALIKAEITPEFILELGSSKDMKVGDKVNVIGAPLGLEGSISQGIISATDRRLFLQGTVFQIDAPVNSGNSGGPCIDKDMKVQGVVFAQISQSQGLNFVIPIEHLKQELPFLYNGGEFQHIWCGAYGKTNKPGNRKNGLDVHYVMPGGTAAFSGIKAGDRIIALDGNEIDSLESFQFYMRQFSSGTVVEMDFVSAAGSNEKLPVYLERRPEAPAIEVYKSDLIQNAFLPLFGMELIHSSTESKKIYTVGKVIPSTSADDLAFSENDTLKIINISLDDQNEAIFCQIYSKRKKKGFLDIGMVLASRYDSPYYF